MCPERDAATLENSGLCAAGGKTGGIAGRAAGGTAGRAAGCTACGTAGPAAGGIAGRAAGGTVGRAVGGTAGGTVGRAAGGIAGRAAGGTVGRAVGGAAGGTGGRAAGGAVGRAAAGGATRPGAGPPRKPGDERRAALGCGARCAGERVASRPFRFGDSVKKNARFLSSRRARRLGERRYPGDQASLLPSGCWATMPCGALDGCGIGSTTLCGNNPRSFVRNTVPIR